ncbi:MAG: hypothetical protein R2911_11190 [Caldilineaceae bacterium]
MVEMTMQIPDELAAQLRPLNGYIPTVLELSLAGFRTLATETATEIVEFLATSPSPQEIFHYHVSERAQDRLQRLLALNSAGLLGESEQLELDELEKIEHILISLKARLAAQNNHQTVAS